MTTVRMGPTRNAGSVNTKMIAANGSKKMTALENLSVNQLVANETKNITAAVVGNGTTRSSINIDALKATGMTVYGCNAFYRDYAPNFVLPDFLVAIDEKIIAEIQASDFPKERFINPPEDEKWEPIEIHWNRAHGGNNWQPQRARSNAGVNAIREAIKHGHKSILIVGFDSMAADPQQRLTNVYDGTPCYGLDTRATPEDSLKRLDYIFWVCDQNRDVTFFFAFPFNIRAYIPTLHNVHRINLGTM